MKNMTEIEDEAGMVLIKLGCIALFMGFTIAMMAIPFIARGYF